MPFCPGCGAEYRHGFTECVDCELVLQEWAPLPRRTPAGTFETWLVAGVITGSVGGALVMGAVSVYLSALSGEPAGGLSGLPIGALGGAILGGVGGLVMGVCARWIDARANRLLIAMVVGGAITGLPVAAWGGGAVFPCLMAIPGAVSGLAAGIIAERRLRLTRP